ncbi:hypothetical protein SAMN02745121_05877 [Nannocystis exedens]|uniref:Uncharacterized protein n=1 Tax=Nannocystis exedens TaxID=54 RepID=A0A1I2E1V0_9BACT|nr:hypothetical protein [Nannocystis exedens]PCC69232.1 hypothetical protein NAEX_02254 [Nannocystis exedens]SFE86902.1 hypothetical protein SAMN02745121_05877 [Nannocystis exedens]
MSLFGGKEIAALQQQLNELRGALAAAQRRSGELEAELAGLRSSHDAAVRRAYELQAELARAEERASTCAARLDRLRAGTRPGVGGASAPSPAFEVIEDAEPDERVVRGRYEIEGRERHLQAVERVLQIAASAGEVGASVYIEVLVDGDGAAQLVARRDGRALRLSAAETRAWLLGQEEALAEVEDIRHDGVLRVELT